MAPNFEEFPSDLPNFVKRKIEGESCSKLAYELEISSGKIVDLMDQYVAKLRCLQKHGGTGRKIKMQKRSHCSSKKTMRPLKKIRQMKMTARMTKKVRNMEKRSLKRRRVFLLVLITKLNSGGFL